MLQFARNTGKIREIPSIFSGIHQQHTVAAVRDRGRQVHSSRRRSDSAPRSGNHDHWQLCLIRARLHNNRLRQPPQFFSLVRHFRICP